MSAVAVEIVRPKMATQTIVVTLLSALAAVFIRAWVLMLVAPAFDWHPGYWASAAAVVAVNCLLGDRSDYKLWTRERAS